MPPRDGYHHFTACRIADSMRTSVLPGFISPNQQHPDRTPHGDLQRAGPIRSAISDRNQYRNLLTMASSRRQTRSRVAPKLVAPRAHFTLAFTPRRRSQHVRTDDGRRTMVRYFARSEMSRERNQSVSQSVISRSRPALTPPPARSPAPPLPVKHKYRVLAPGGYSIVALRTEPSFPPCGDREISVGDLSFLSFLSRSSAVKIAISVAFLS